MRVDIMTLFPDTLGDVMSESILGRAQDRGIIRIEAHQIRDYTANKQNQTDDYPYGGGRGAVMTADQNQVLHLAQPDGICLLKSMTAGRKVDGMDRACGLVTHRFPAAVQRIRRHHRATTAAVGVIVGLVLLVGGIIPDLVGFDADDAAVLGTAQNAVAEHIPHRVGKQGQNINSHRFAYPR